MTFYKSVNFFFCLQKYGVLIILKTITEIRTVGSGRFSELFTGTKKSLPVL